MFDILIKNGHVVDPANGINGVKSIAIQGNRIASIGDKTDAAYVIDADGCFVFPGLIDFHAHFFNGGGSHGIVPDMMVANGVTTVCDAGSVGAANFESFHRSVIANSKVHVYAGLNLDPIGQPGFGYCEDLRPEHYPRNEIVQLLDRYSDVIRFVKIRIGEEIVGPDALNYLKSAVAYCEELGLPLVVHASNTPCTAEETANELRTGDVFCHCFHGKNNPIMTREGAIYPAVLEARKRGVLFDACNGRSNFACWVGKKAIEQNFYPDFIGTDCIPDYTNRNGFAKSLPYLMSKYLELGMPLVDIIRAVTETPAKWLNLSERGNLSPDSFADVAIFRQIRANTVYKDNLGDSIEGSTLLQPQMTILDGTIVFSQIDF